MIVLRPTHLSWVHGDDDPHDLCAHSPVEFRVGDVVLVRPENGCWTVSAAALYLLRTLTRDHTRAAPVGDHLFPCCGFAMYEIEGADDVLVVGCPNGGDVSVERAGADVRLHVQGGPAVTVSAEAWRSAVHGFSDAVDAFYQRSAPREPHDCDARGFAAFRREWIRRRAAPSTSHHGERPCP